MAMSGTVLGQAIASALGVTDATATAAIVTFCTQIVEHIQTNATITVTATATAVTAGAGTSPVTGTATIA